MSLLESALYLASMGFHVFRVVPGRKDPPMDEGFPTIATRDPDLIREWWSGRPYNIGISTTRFKESEALLVVDVDRKNGKSGPRELLRLELEGREFPSTYTQVTPTGGSHLFYRVGEPVRQGENIFGPGLDIRSKGGYAVGAGSVIQGMAYTGDDQPVTPAPQWMIEACGRVPDQPQLASYADQIDGTWARLRAIDYLEHVAPPAIEGSGGDGTTYRVACVVKDEGVDAETCLDLMLRHWNDRCVPPWTPDQLRTKVENAYRYGQAPVGVIAPEAQFQPVPDRGRGDAASDLHPFEKLNREFAFVTVGGGAHILWETVRADGSFRLEHLGIEAFHQKLAAQTMLCGDGKMQKISRLWMASDRRRSFDGICFRPGNGCPPTFYNLWRGFAVDAGLTGLVQPAEAALSLKMWLDHARDNICHGDEVLFRWLVGYFAHLVQRPWEKPQVALVLRGAKGVGKNALVERVGRLIRDHFLVASNPRYLSGNFNSHLENTLLFVLDEAIWAGDKKAEGVLKDLITGQYHLIEHKGKEPYQVENCTRIVLIGNEEWIVPASEDERRFAVFDVGDGRKQDRAYFKQMKVGMEAGGYQLLLHHLLHYDLTGIDINEAPMTRALLDQKIATLEPFHEWWRESLSQGRIVGSDFSGDWPRELSTNQFRDAFGRYVRDRNVRSRIPTEKTLGKLLRRCLRSVERPRRREDGERQYLYVLPDLEQCRQEWDSWIGHGEDWPE